MNKTILIGRLTKDPEIVNAGNSDIRVAKFGLAVNRIYKKEGQQEADFFNVTSFKSVDFIEQYLKKGALVAIEARIEINQYEDSDGNKKTYTNIMCENIQALSSKSDNSSGSNNASTSGTKKSKNNSSDDDLPF